MIEAGGEGISRRALLMGAGGVAGAGLVTAAATPLASLGPTLNPLHRRRGCAAYGWSTTRAALLGRRHPRRRVLHRAARARRSRFASAPACSSCACRPSSSTCRADRRAWAPEGILAYSKICPHAGCAISLYRYPTYAPTSQVPAFTCPCHYSTFLPGEGGRLVFGPAGRALPQLPLMIDSDRNLRAAGPFPGTSGRRGGACAGSRVNLLERTPTAGSYAPSRAAEQRVGMAGAIKWALRYVFPDHWSFLLGEIALYSFIVLVATGIFLTLYYIPSDSQVIYHGPYTLLRGEQMSEAYRSVLNLSLQRPGGPAVPPGPPLGGGRLHRLDRAAPDADLLHRRLPQAARPQLLHRPDDADAGDPRGLRRLLAGRRPAVGHGPGHRLRGGAVDPVHRRAARQPGLGRPVPGQRHVLAAPGDRPRAAASRPRWPC